MAFPRSLARRRRATRRAQQRGIVMAITLIALVLLLVGMVAMLRNVDSSGMVVGNLAFRRDLTNRAESAIYTAKTVIAAGTLTTASVPGSNYSSYRLAETNGLPTVLLSDSLYSSAGYTSTTTTDGSITLYWVIDRQCLITGAFDTASCEFVSSSGDTGGSNFLKKPSGSSKAVYRISVRAKGPRNSEAYFQTTYSY